MTCIIGFKSKLDGKTYIAHDSICKDNSTGKMFEMSKVIKHINFSIGFAGKLDLLNLCSLLDFSKSSYRNCKLQIQSLMRMNLTNGTQVLVCSLEGMERISLNNDSIRIDVNHIIEIGDHKDSELAVIGTGAELVLGYINATQEKDIKLLLENSIRLVSKYTPLVGGTIKVEEC